MTQLSDEVVGWQPIETYDGTYGVLLYRAGEIPYVGARTGLGWVGLVDGSEFDASDDPQWSPTHWMRLPAPPWDIERDALEAAARFGFVPEPTADEAKGDVVLDEG